MIVTALFLATCTLSALSAAKCPAGTVQGMQPTECYVLKSSATTWMEAYEKCLGRGGQLTSVTSAFHNAFLTEVSREYCQSCESHWLGGTYGVTSRSTWTWSDGEQFLYTNWASGQPLREGTLCLYLNATGGQWYSGSCDVQRSYVCKIPALGDEPKPTPPLCDDGWTHSPASNKCYKLIASSDLYWIPSLQTCLKIGADLPSVHSDYESAWLAGFATNNTDHGWITLGLSRTNDNSNWTWSDGTPLDYENWHATPANTGDLDCSFFFTRFYHDGSASNYFAQWYPYNCNVGAAPVVCQKPVIQGLP